MILENKTNLVANFIINHLRCRLKLGVFNGCFAIIAKQTTYFHSYARNKQE